MAVKGLFELFVPGRLCLFGEHSDWAGRFRLDDPRVEPGMCLITGTDQGLYARAEPVDGSFVLRQLSPRGAPGRFREYPAHPAALRTVAASGSFDSYAAGTAALLLEEHRAGGLRLDIHRRTLPLKKGLSSSAAVCVLTARAFGRAWGLGLSTEQEMDLAYRGEQLAGSRCGRMDQACAFGRGNPVLLDFDGDVVRISRVNPGGDFHLLIVDLKGEKDTRRILGALNSSFAGGRRSLRRALGTINRRIVSGAAAAMEAGDARLLGDLMSEAQSVFDHMVAPECPEELSAPKLHRFLTHPALKELAWGAKGVGSQGDGTAQVVCRGPKEGEELAAVLKRDSHLACLPVTIPGYSAGAWKKGRP